MNIRPGCSGKPGAATFREAWAGCGFTSFRKDPTGPASLNGAARTWSVQPDKPAKKTNHLLTHCFLKKLDWIWFWDNRRFEKPIPKGGAAKPNPLGRLW